MRALKIGFVVSLAVWLGGALITAEHGTKAKQLEMLMAMSGHDVFMMNLRGISVNLFGLLTVVSGTALAALWLIRKYQSSPAEDSIRLDARAPTEGPHAAPAARPSTAGAMRCDFTGWVTNGNRIVQEFKYSGGSFTEKLAIEITVERGSLAILRLVNIWLMPANEYQGLGEIRLTDEVSRKSPGWLRCQIATANGDATIINISDRAEADAVFDMLAEQNDLEFSIRVQGEVVRFLPMPNEAGLRAAFEAVRAKI